MRVDAALWRALAVYRVAALLYAAGSFAAHYDSYAHPRLGLVVLSGMTVWTAVTAWLYDVPGRRRWSWLAVDLVVTLAALLSTVLVVDPARVDAGDPTITVSWAAAPVVAWAVHAGWRGGLAAAVAVGTGAVLARGGASQATVNSLVLLVLLGSVVGYVVALARAAEQAQAAAVRLQAAAAERERLARRVHDGVLQTLALVSRRSGDATLAGLAAEQEQALRRLISAAPEAATPGVADVRTLLPAGPDIELVAPATPVLLDHRVAAELSAAAGAAVDNARQHAGGRVWLLVEDEGDAVVVTVRDDGPGIPPGRLEQAERDGRLGVAQCIRGRVEDLGGQVALVSAPEQGTEVELRVPRR